MRLILLFSLTLMLWSRLSAQSDFSTAEPMVAGTAKNGTVGPGNRNAYFKTLLPANGTVTVYIEGEHKGGSAGSIDFYAYDKQRRQIAVKYTLGNKNIIVGEKFKDTVRIYSRSADSIYMLIYQSSSQTFDFTMRYEVLNQSVSDPEPNDNFLQAKPLNQGQVTQGQIGYVANNITDRSDYYRTLLPKSGTVTIYIEGLHTGGSAGSVDLYAYDKGRRQIQVKYTLGGKNISNGENFKDTVRIYSRDADSIYLQLYQGSNQSFSYKLQYEVTDQNIDDPEPNDDFDNAVSVIQEETRYGRIGNISNNVTDRSDYYKTLLPAAGTVTVYIEGIHTGGSAGALDFYSYDKSRRQVAVKYTLGGKNITLGERFRDTIEITSRAADSLYFQLYQGSSQSFDYSIRYAVTRQSPDDAEPNNTAEQALKITHQDTLYGKIGYITDGVTDRSDYYQAILPADGTVNIYVGGTHTGGSAGSIDLYVYDKHKRQIAVKYTLGGKNITLGQQLSDTVKVYSRAADTLYILLYQGSNQSFDYAISYEVLDQSPNDLEPNNDLVQAVPLLYQEVANGHIGYVADNVTDRNDYYQAVLPADGTVTIYVQGTHTGGGAGSVDLYVYDKHKRQIAVKYTLGDKNITLGQQLSDTVRVYSRAADTLYFLMYQGSARSFSYGISYEVMDQSANDPEPNNDFPQAKPIAHGENVVGHIGYVADNVTDRNDYFKTLLPADGTVTVYIEGVHTGGTSGAIDFYVYDKSRRQIIVKYTLGGKNIGYGEAFRDTIEIASRAADSLYFLMYQGSSQSFSYKLRYSMPEALQGDPEPNNTFDEAVEFVKSDTLKGLLGYVSNNVTDRYDYYKIGLPEKSSAVLYIEGTHTGGSDGSFSFYAYDKNRRQVSVKYEVGKKIAAGETLRDTITVNCNATDSLYVLFYQSSNRSFTYTVRLVVTDSNKPVASFSYTRTGNEFGFINESKKADKWLWRLGNQTITVTHPLQELKPGFYPIQLIATNNTCNFSDTAKEDITVSGIEYFTPDEAGIGSDFLVTIFGGGLVEDTRVTLSANGKELNTVKQFTDDKGKQLGAVFDLHFATPGVYDLTIRFPNEQPIVYEKAITVNEMVYPETWSEVTGPAIWRTGRAANFNLVVGHNGNSLARGAIVALAWPKSVNIEWVGKEYKPDASEYTEVVMDDGEVIRTRNDAVHWVYDINTTTPIDTFGTEPFDGYIRYFTVPAIPAGTTYDMPFRATSTGSGTHVFKTFTIKPNQFGSCETFNIGSALTGPQAVELYINTLDLAVDELKVPPMTKIPAQVAVKSLKVTQKHIDVSSNILFHRMWAKWYGADDLTESEYYDYYKEGLAADEFAVNQMKDIAFDKAVDFSTGPLIKKRTDRLTDQLHASNEAMLNHKNLADKYMSRPKKGTSKAKRAELKRLGREETQKWKEAFESGDKTIDELRQLEFLDEMLQDAKDLKNLTGQLELLKKYVEENCPEHKKQVQELIDKLGKEEDIIGPRDKDTETRTSYDPNAIYGPSGFRSQRFVNNKDKQSFVVMFENVDTAKADAQIVRIVDTLDKSKFDLSTFEFGNITVGNKYFKVPNGRQQFMMEKNLAPDVDMKVRINGTIDTATGIVFWQFTSIDPQTGDLPDFNGFLPPNVNYPSGEGSVSYTVNPVSNLPDGAELVSRASIVFDTNEPILTNTWKNTIDAGNPQGNLKAKIYEDSLIVLEYSAADAGSGVDYYNLYMSENNGQWIPVPGGNGDSILFLAEPGKTYQFYMEAQDRTGNRERKDAVGEAIVTVPVQGATSDDNALMLYPIPSNGTVHLELNVPELQQLAIAVYSTSGQKVAELYNGSAAKGMLKVTKALHRLSSGLYFVHAKGSRGINLKNKLIIVK